MERYYRHNYQGHYYAQRDQYMNVWCEICGGPHYTQNCPYSSGHSTYYYSNPYPHPQSFESYNLPPPEEEVSPSLIESHKALVETFNQWMESDEERKRVQAGNTPIWEVCYAKPPLFLAMCKLAADLDPNLQSVGNLLDRLVKDIVIESD
ncbi:hypothetical protein L1987_53284 [Smallanthus sonchifolius]|uniref:Uncharacterized protein n=1 Tax=Smallanthus sonchifolius TaxID=185202 RepID=A0ACB9EVF6_9ASTR|nr:hypothetical protein L1987_53284 [Smallanthus sonchifolius]